EKQASGASHVWHFLVDMAGLEGGDFFLICIHYNLSLKTFILSLKNIFWDDILAFFWIALFISLHQFRLCLTALHDDVAYFT
ncbi:hypothetical protein ACJX0J_011796, partial [Zea mays]